MVATVAHASFAACLPAERALIGRCSMDGKGAWRDNVFVERFWRTIKYEEVYLRAYDGVEESHSGAKWGSTLKPSKFLMPPFDPRRGTNAVRFRPQHSRKRAFSGVLPKSRPRKTAADGRRPPAKHPFRESRRGWLAWWLTLMRL